MQFVWCYRRGEAKEESLRYSMRSVEKHFAGDVQIVLVGDCPSWYKGVHVPIKPIERKCNRHIQRDWYNRVLAACFSKQVCDNFVLMQNSVYFLESVSPEDVVKPRHGGGIRRKNLNAITDTNMEKVRKRDAFNLLPNNIFYDYSRRLPMWVNSHDLIAIEAKHSLLATYQDWEQVYGNAHYKDPDFLRPFFTYIKHRKTVDGWKSVSNRCRVVGHSPQAWDRNLESFLEEEFGEAGRFEFDRSSPSLVTADKILKNGPTLEFVWPYIHSQEGGEELKLSIASVEKYYQGKAKILVIGDKPSWYNGMHIRVPRLKAGNYRSFRDVYSKLMTACNTPMLKDSFVWFMDDIYMTRPVSYEELKVPRYQSEKTVEQLEAWTPSNKWLTLKKKTMLKVAKEKGVCYDFATHLPHFVVKQKLKESLRGMDLHKAMYLWEIIYGNHRNDVAPQPSKPFFFRTTRPVSDITTFENKEAKIFNNGNYGWCPELETFLKNRIIRGDEHGQPGESSISITSSRKSRCYAVIPFSGRDAARVRNMNFVRSWAEERFDEVIVSETPPEEVFNKSFLVNRGVESLDADPQDVIALIDADFIISDKALADGVDTARSHKGIVYPYTTFKKLCPSDTRHFMRNGLKRISDWTAGRGGVNCGRSKCPGGIILLSYANWLEAGGMDERFTEWGHEDVAWRNQCRNKLGREIRLDYTALHLHHRRNRNKPTANRSYVQEYR